ncbi:hypothetical protein [uncultured Endozoicomonas sp.]|uniref:hypothetical protein n=1 Tax=uncultured Endozoicomonas sp. TaxID=432652 RepID=UPI002607B3E9|nr:hypothetical protein [uncultured Endozoicomonas sp.]
MDSLNNASPPWDYAVSPDPDPAPLSRSPQSSARNQIDSGELSFSSTAERTSIRIRNTGNITANGFEVSDGKKIRTFNSIDALLNDPDLWSKFKKSGHYTVETACNNVSEDTLKESLKKDIKPFINFFNHVRRITIRPANSRLQSPRSMFLPSTGQAFSLQDDDDLSLVRSDEELARALQEQFNREAENPGSSLGSQYPNTTTRQLNRSTSEILATVLTPEELEEAREAQRQHNQQQNLNADHISSSNTAAQRLVDSRDGIRHPAKVTVQTRLETFNGHEAVFDRLGIPVLQLAINGLFWDSEPDRVKCFCCNNGLQNWNQGEDPAVEMAKWYGAINVVQGNQTTSCRFVRAMINDDETVSQLFMENNGNGIHSREMRSMNNSRELRRSNNPFSFSRENLSGHGRMPATLYELEHGETREEANARILGRHAPGFANELPSTSGASRRNNNDVEMIDPRPGNASTEDPLLNIEQHPPREQWERLRKVEQSTKCKNLNCRNPAEVTLSCGHISACMPCAEALQQKALEDRKCFVCGEKSTLFLRTYRV